MTSQTQSVGRSRLLRLMDRRVRLSRHILRASELALKKGGKWVPEDKLVPIRTEMEHLRTALLRDDVAAIKQRSAALDALVNEHLAAARKPAWRESLESIGAAVLVALLLRAFVFEAFKIPSGSMIPTLAIGDQLFVNKIIFGLRIPFTTTRLVHGQTPKRGDVVVFIYPHTPHDDYIKRVVGLPGDDIKVIDGILSINGAPVQRRSLGSGEYWDWDAALGWQRFAAQAFEEQLDDHRFTVLQDNERSTRDFGPYKVPAGHVWVMGDDRDRSADSRAWGPVPFDNLVGRSTFVFFSWGHKGPELQRIGTWVQ